MKIFLSILCVSVSFLISAQNNLKFEKVDHDFGEIKEDDGPAEFTFRFVNEGSQAIRITNVKASCGCTTPGMD